MTRRTPLHCGLASGPRLAAREAAAARTAIAQTVDVTLGWRLADGVLTLAATTPKRGARYVDSWSVSPSLALATATATDSSLPGRATYVSRAVAGASSLTPETTYTFSYAIVMRAGAATWAGSRSLTVTVGPDGSPASPASARRTA